jgi:hypothetical protein
LQQAGRLAAEVMVNRAAGSVYPATKLIGHGFKWRARNRY